MRTWGCECEILFAALYGEGSADIRVCRWFVEGRKDEI